MRSTKPSLLCTGPVEQSLIEIAGDKDVDMDVVHFTEIKSLLSLPTETEIKQALQQKAIVVFTSSNAIRPVTKFLEDKKPAWTIYCIGQTTYQLAKEYFGEDNIRQTANNAAALAEKIIADNNTSEVIFFCGNLRRNDLPAALAQKKISVKEIVVYHTTLTPQAIKKEYEAILFFSPSAAESFFRANKLPAKTVMFVMGQATAEEIKKHSPNKIIIGDEPVKSTLVNKAIQFVRDNFSELKRDRV